MQMPKKVKAVPENPSVSSKSMGRRVVWVMAALVLSSTLMSCTAHRMYRPEGVVHRADYRLAFVEFDDQGEVWSRQQIAETRNQIRNANRSEDGAVFVVMAHGWNNDASPRNERRGTLAGFEQLLQQIADDVHTENPGRPVLGIYLGWRGQSLHGPLKYATFFSRQRAAARVAGSQGMVLLGQIVLEAKRNPESNLVVLGHSLGGQIIERLTQTAVASGLFYIDGEPLPASADLTVVLNPASPATNAKQVIDLLRWNRLGLQRRAPDGSTWTAPTLVSITSETDVVTRFAYTGASMLGMLTRRFRRYGPEFCSPIDRQRRIYTRTAGHSPVLYSHEVNVSPLTDDAVPFSAEAEDGWFQREQGFDVLGQTVQVEWRRRQGAYNDTPFWITRVPWQVMNGHGDAWNPNLIALLRGLLRQTGALESGTEVRVIRKLGEAPVFLWRQGDGSLGLVDRSRRVFQVEPGRRESLMRGCVPDEIDLANVLGHDGRQEIPWIVHQRQARDLEKTLTELLEIELADSGFQILDRTLIETQVPPTHAAVDAIAGEIYLADSTNLWVVRRGKGRKLRPEILESLDLIGDVQTLILDNDRRRLLLLDGESQRLMEVDLTGTTEPTEVATDLGQPSLLTLDPRNGDLLTLDAASQTLRRRALQGRRFGAAEVLAQRPGLEHATAMEVTEDGFLWLVNPKTSSLLQLAPDGTWSRWSDRSSLEGFALEDSEAPNS